MAEYYEGIAGVKPSEKQIQDAAHKEHQEKQQTRKDAAERHAKAHDKPGPAERMYGQDRHINTHPEHNPNERANQRAEPTQAQKEMQAKREAARAEDRKQAKTDYSDKKYSELSKKTPPSQSR